MYRLTISLASKNKWIEKTEQTGRRHFWQWLNIIFNRVDESRVKAVGPETACAEWLLKNGAKIRWAGSSEFVGDYNTLPKAPSRQTIEEVDASGSSVSHYGFPHFAGCDGIAALKLHDCGYVTDDAIRALRHVSSPLARLEISKCQNVTDAGLLRIPALPLAKRLRTLALADLISVEDLDGCRERIAREMPACDVL